MMRYPNIDHNLPVRQQSLNNLDNSRSICFGAMCRHTIQRQDFHTEMGSSRQIKRAMIFQFHLHIIKSSIFVCSIKSNFMGRPKELLPVDSIEPFFCGEHGARIRILIKYIK